jgi:hypothetical protein
MFDVLIPFGRAEPTPLRAWDIVARRFDFA